MSVKQPEHQNFFTTKLEEMANWARKNSLWPMPFGTACCAIEYMSCVSSTYDVARFGAEVVRISDLERERMSEEEVRALEQKGIREQYLNE